LSLDALDTARSIAERLPAPESKIKWKAVKVVRGQGWKFAPAKLLYEHPRGVGVLFLLYLAMVNTIAVKEVDRLANGKGLNSIAFVASWQTGDVRSAVDLLVIQSVRAKRRCLRGCMRRFVAFNALRGVSDVGVPRMGFRRPCRVFPNRGLNSL